MSSKLSQILNGIGLLGAVLSKFTVGRILLDVVAVVERLIAGHAAVDKLKRRSYVAVAEGRGIDLDATEAEELARIFRLLDEINEKVEKRARERSVWAVESAERKARAKAVKLAAKLARKEAKRRAKGA
jgi:hypothetical protein